MNVVKLSQNIFSFSRSFRSSIWRTCSILLVSLLYSCSANVILLEGSYPPPLIEALPLTVGVYYDDALKNHTYIEINDRNGEDEHIINSGSSQTSLFNSLLPAVFEKTVLIDDINDLSRFPEIDLVFAPTIEEFQVGLPQKTRLDVYEIWLKYNMRLLDSSGDYIADWVMTAYGKSPTETFASVDKGVNEAANVAMRDLSASFSLGFKNIPEVKEWLQNNEITMD